MSNLRTAWSMVGRTLVLDAQGKEAIRPGTDIGGHGWHAIKDEWERMAPVYAAAPEMRAAVDELLALAYQYRDDLMHPVTDDDSRKRRVQAIDAAIAKAGAAHV